MDFERRKAETLASLAASWPDKSPKGSVDAPIVPLLDAINRHSSFFTTSSCSGRISILRQPGESPKPNPDENKTNPRKSKKKAGGGGWIFVSHEPADPEAIVNLLFESTASPSAVDMEGAEGGTLVFRFEPLIVAVECKDVMAAKELVATAIACGFRESGITSIHKRVMVAIRCSLRLEVPLGQVGLIMVSPEYIRYLIGVANEKMEANRRRTDGFFHVLQDKVLPGSAKKLNNSAKKAYAQVAGEINLLDFEAKQRNMISNKSQLEHEEMQSHSQDYVSDSINDKGDLLLSIIPKCVVKISRCSLGILTKIGNNSEPDQVNGKLKNPFI